MFWDSPFAATLQDLDFRLVAVNRAYVDFTGFPESMLVGLDPVSLQPEEDRAVNLALRKQMKVEQEAGKPPPLIERRIIDAAGRERWFRAMRRTVRDAKGRTLLLAVLQDVTEEHAVALARRTLHAGARAVARPEPARHGAVRRRPACWCAAILRSRRWLAWRPCRWPMPRPPLRELLGWDARGPRPDLQPGAPPLASEVLLPLADGAACASCARPLRCLEFVLGQRRYIAVVEDRSLEEERDLARLQIGALIDTAGVGSPTFHESLGWLKSSAPPAGRRRSIRAPRRRCRPSAATSSSRPRCPTSSGCSRRCAMASAPRCATRFGTPTSARAGF